MNLAGGRHNENKRRKGAGTGSETVGTGRPSGRPSAGCVPVRATGGKIEAKVLAAELKGEARVVLRRRSALNVRG